eukprot:m.169481 g.169481  ORF g.169481 m.169481 type:complete len:475 (-) comp16669_c0_seq4:1938-3362(-)
MSEAFQLLSAGLKLRAPKSKSRASKAASKAPSLDFFGDKKAVPTTTSQSLDRASKQDVSTHRKQHRIFVKGSDVPPPLSHFEQMEGLGVPAALAQAVTATYERPSAIQMQAIPAILTHRDVLGVAPTGSGKTLAFGIPVLSQLGKPGNAGFRACVIAPTRELSQQIARELEVVNKQLKLQIRLLTKANSASLKSNQKLDVLIATPMRLVSAIQRGLVDLSHVEWLVVDEADRLFENGFETQIDEIIAACTSPQRRIALFSATMPQRVEELAQTVLNDYIRIVINAAHAANFNVKQSLTFVGAEDGKMTAMRQLLQKGLSPPILVFVQSKSRAKELFQELVYEDINIDVIHSDRTQQQRDDVIKQFREGKVWMLICTDLMGRGVDFKGVNMVINYDFPPNATEYIHRVGTQSASSWECGLGNNLFVCVAWRVTLLVQICRPYWASRSRRRSDYLFYSRRRTVAKEHCHCDSSLWF